MIINVSTYRVEEMRQQDLKQVNGGLGWGDVVSYLGGKVLDGIIWCASETHKRGTLFNMYQVDVKLWN